MKNKLILLLLVLVALVFTFAACTENAETTAETTTTAPDVTTEIPAITTTTAPDVTTTTAPIVTTSVPVTTTVPATTVKTPVTTTPLDGDDPMAAYKFVSEKLNALRGFEAVMVEESSYAGETSTMEVGVKISFADGKKAFMSMPIAEEGPWVDATYIDGIVYCVVKMPGLEMKYKTQDASMTSTFEKLFAIFEEKNDEDDEKDDVGSVVFGKREKGVYTLVATATEEEALESIMADYEDFEIDASAFSNISNVITFECNAEGYVTKIVEALTYTFDGEVYSETTTLTFKNAGVLPEITAPADADSYMNMDEME